MCVCVCVWIAWRSHLALGEHKRVLLESSLLGRKPLHARRQRRGAVVDAHLDCLAPSTVEDEGEVERTLLRVAVNVCFRTSALCVFVERALQNQEQQLCTHTHTHTQAVAWLKHGLLEVWGKHDDEARAEWGVLLHHIQARAIVHKSGRRHRELFAIQSLIRPPKIGGGSAVGTTATSKKSDHRVGRDWKVQQ